MQEVPLTPKILYPDRDDERDIGRVAKRFRKIYLSDALSDGSSSATIAKILSATLSVHVKQHHLTSTADHVGVSGTAGEIFQLNASGLPVSSGKSFTTTLGDPGVDTLVPTEKAVRTAITAIPTTQVSQWPTFLAMIGL